MSMLSAAYVHTTFSYCLGKRYSFKTYTSLFIILSGVMITSKTEMSLTSRGLFIGLSSAMGSAAFSVYMKMVLTSTKLHTSNIMFVVASVSLLCIFPIWSLVDLRRMIYTGKAQVLTQFRKAAYMLVLDGVARCSQNLLAIVMLSRLTALAYSVASVVKRLFVILTAIVFFATPASALTLFGLSLAMTGLLLYNLNEGHQIKDTGQSSETELIDDNASMKNFQGNLFCGFPTFLRRGRHGLGRFFQHKA
ncbi:Solute carrier family 35 member E1 [Taenia crassiceps]|uniref:Solute carrier family 35 member E1 n=1 Tax=Taenia crassiceps TaxID=6207 RepID=A0ABR4QAH8_9CEST